MWVLNICDLWPQHTGSLSFTRFIPMAKHENESTYIILYGQYATVHLRFEGYLLTIIVALLEGNIIRKPLIPVWTFLYLLYKSVTYHGSNCMHHYSLNASLFSMWIERHDFLESNEPFIDIALLIEAISQFLDTYLQLYITYKVYQFPLVQLSMITMN